MNSLIELKAQAYDCLAQIEHLQRELQRINQLIMTCPSEETLPKPNDLDK